MRQIFKDCDLNGDGKITFPEFEAFANRIKKDSFESKESFDVV